MNLIFQFTEPPGFTSGGFSSVQFLFLVTCRQFSSGSQVQRSCRKSGQHIETPVTRNGFHLMRQRTSAYTTQQNHYAWPNRTVTRPITTMPSLHTSLLQGCLARQAKGATRRDTQHTTSLQPAATSHQPAATSHQPRALHRTHPLQFQSV